MKYYLSLLLILPLLSVFGQIGVIDSLLNSVIDHESLNPVHSILLCIDRPDNGFNYNKGIGTLDADAQSASKNDQFRIASAAKLFVSTIILQLVEEGKIDLSDQVFQHLNKIKYLDFENFHILDGKKFAREITVEQLLSHRTGLADIFTDKEEEFFRVVMQNPDKQYSSESIVDLYYQFHLNRTPHFEPGKGWHYSDMNYVLLGLLNEQMDQVSLPYSIRFRILNPLKMRDTYFEFYEDPVTHSNRISQYVGNINFTELNTSFDWAGGGLVSTNRDLVTFIQALFDLKLISQESLNKMIAVRFNKKNENRYGLGMYESHYNGHTYYGHYGFYGTYVGYCPVTKTAISYSIAQASPDFNVHVFISDILKGCH